jgi:hypothetical protein
MFAFAFGLVASIIAFKIIVIMALIFGIPALLFGSFGVCFAVLIVMCVYEEYCNKRAAMNIVNRRNRDRLYAIIESRRKVIGSYFWDDDSI